MAIRERLESVKDRLWQEIRTKPIRTIGKVAVAAGIVVGGYNFIEGMGAHYDAVVAEAQALKTTDPVEAEELYGNAADLYGDASNMLGNAAGGFLAAAGGVSLHLVASARDYNRRHF